MAIASAMDFRAAAKRRLPPFLFEYVDGGSYAEVTLRRNVADLEAWRCASGCCATFRSSTCRPSCSAQKCAMPFGLGPVGLSGMYARRGEVQAARAAQAAGIPFALSTVSCCSLREVAEGVDKPIWFQLYVIKDRGFMRTCWRAPPSSVARCCCSPSTCRCRARAIATSIAG